MATKHLALLLLLALTSASVLPGVQGNMMDSVGLPGTWTATRPLLEELLLQALNLRGLDSRDVKSALAKRNRLCFFSPVTCYK